MLERLKIKLFLIFTAGTGTIAQILAPIAKRVLGVEIVTEAVDAARQNAKLNNLENCTFKAERCIADYKRSGRKYRM